MSETLITLLDVIATVCFLAAMVMALRISAGLITRPARIFLFMALAAYAFHSFGNVLEHGGITDALDLYGDYTETLFFPFFLFFLYAYGSEQSRRAIERLLSRELLLNSIGEGIISVDKYGNIVFINPAASRMLGYERKDLIGMSVGILCRAVTGAMPLEKIGTGELGDLIGGVLVRKDGSSYAVDHVVTPVTENGKPAGAVVVFSDATESRKVEAALRESEARFRGAFENLKVGFSIVDLKGRFMKANPFLCKMLGYTEEKLQGMTFSDITHPEDIHKGTDAAVRMIEGGIDHTWVEKRYIRKDGRMIHGLTSVALIRDAGGAPAYFVGLWQDVTEKISAERRLRLFSDALTQSMDGVQVVDLEGNIIYSNPAVEEIYGYSHDELLGRHVSAMNADAEFAGRVILPALRESGRWSGEVLVRHKDGREFPIWLSTSMVRSEGGEPIAMIGIIRDVTEHKKAEERISASLKEKEALLMEIHHRVKNNMQIVISLLRLQAGLITDEKALAAFRETQNRIKSMAIVHESLYDSGDFAGVDFQSYFRALSGHLINSLGTRGRDISLRTELQEGVLLPIESAIPCGLIITELMTNALKYAFPPGSRGEVFVSMKRIGEPSSSDEGEDEFEIVVRDNGVGIPEDIDPSTSKTLGLHLVYTLGRDQLQGSVDLIRDGGTKFRIRFRSPQYKKRIEA